MQPSRALNTSRNSILKQGHKTSFVLFLLLSLSSTHLFTPTPPPQPISGTIWRSLYKRSWAFLLHPMLHDDSWLWDRLVDGFVRQDVGTVQIQLIVHDHILPQNRHVLHTNLRMQMDPETLCYPLDYHHNTAESERGWRLILYSPTGQQRSSSPRCSSPAMNVIALVRPSSQCSVLSSPHPPQPHQHRC